ncbi:MAG: CCA tRNA nucleotidyltransferase [Thermoplasmata archaeon]|nr:CCA tRNA nucleotidyltransferase [Thermoplasmata archaeon]MCI4353761.1 CCA tRNA nucleotidyltransferase [Thermoplasmata archaeon]
MADPTGPDAGAIEREVLRRITPDAATEERLVAVLGRLVARAETVARERNIPVRRSLVAGSAARRTYLKDRMDIDLFLLFPPETSRPDLERFGLELGAALLENTQTRYAEHPYRRGVFEGFAVDAVPGYAIDDPSHPLSAVDRTPFHQAFLLAHQTPAMVGQVRLAKQFFRGLGIYGSEARTAGLSGYLVELLILRFGSLDALLGAARTWRIPVRFVSTPGASPRVPEDVALVLDDPVDPGRNVATALSRRNLGVLILAAAEYLDRPTATAFDLPSRSTLAVAAARTRVAERATHVTVLWLPRPELVDDILYPQLRKAERSVAEEAVRLGFAVLGTASAAGEGRVVVAVELEHGTVPTVRWQDGPPAGIDRVGSFLGKWTQPDAPVLQGPYVTAEGKLAVETRRSERRFEPLLLAALDRLTLGRDLKPGPGATVSIRSLDEESDDPALGAALSELLEKRLPWRRA